MSNPSITADKTPWYQWDTGLTVTVSGGAMNECHFANRKQGTAYVQAVINGIARVPDELLQVEAPIKAYGYVSDGAGGKTYIEQIFEVIARNIPSDYTYTKTAQKTIRDAETARDQAVQAAKDAKASELAAGDSAVEASKSAQSAGESASAAATSESNAAKSAGDAAQSATDASKAVEDASELLKTYTDNAKTSADNAATSASNAADSASAASGSAIAAAHSATDASNAKAAAQTAKDGAEAARNDAATSASNAATSADNAAKSASDAAKTLTEAKQYTDANSSNALVGTVSGKLLHVEDAWPSPVRELVVYGKSVQNGTPTPDAPVPIESVSKLSVVSTGKNLLTYPYYSKSKVEYGVAFTDNGDGSISVDGTNTSSTGAIFDIIVPGNNSAYSIFPAGTYNAYAKESISNDYAIYFSIRRDTYYGKELLINGNNISGERSWRFTLSEPTRLFIRIGVGGKKTVVKTTVNVSLCASEDTDPYYPYVGSTTQNLLVSEDGTSYELRSLPDDTRDELVVKDGRRSLVKRVLKYQADGSEMVYYNSTAKECTFNIDYANSGSKVYNVKCDKLPTVTSTSNNLGCSVWGSTIYFMVPDVITDTVSAKAWLAENKPTFLLRLATTETIDLGPADPILLPETVSNVWVNNNLTPDCAMTYKRDINVAFGNLVQAVVAAAAGE